jgi:hypothetical protein
MLIPVGEAPDGLVGPGTVSPAAAGPSTTVPAIGEQPQVGAPRSRRDHKTHRRTGIVAGCLIATLITPGCGGQPAQNSSRRAVGNPRSGEPTSARSQNAAIAAYRGFFPAVDRALRSSPEQARAILQDFAVGGYLDFEIRQIVDHQARGLEPWGRTVVHVTRVDLSSATATVHDCQDASQAGLADRRTHRLVPQSRGNTHRHLVAYLTLGRDSRWRLTDLIQQHTTCRAS